MLPNNPIADQIAVTVAIADANILSVHNANRQLL